MSTKDTILESLASCLELELVNKVTRKGDVLYITLNDEHIITISTKKVA